MTMIRWFMQVLILVWFAVPAFGQTDPPPLSPGGCIDLMNGRTAALVAEDWPQLEVLALRTIRLCRDVLPSEAISSAQCQRAMAALATGRPSDALAA